MQKNKQSPKQSKRIGNGRQKKNNSTKGITDAKLLKYLRDAALERAGYRCEFPDCHVNYSQLHCHHIYHRSHASLRYDLRNAIILCPTHHTLSGLSAHKNPDFKEILIAGGVRTADFFDQLRAERNRIQKNTQAWKDQCYDELKAYL